MGLRRGALLGALLLVSPTWCQRAASATDLRAPHGQLRSRWLAEVTQIADQCAARGHQAESEEIRRLLQPPERGVLRISVLPTIGPPAATAPVRSSQSPCQAALSRVEKQYARKLFQLARAAFRAGDIAYCYDLVREVVEHDPDYGEARALLGFTRYRDSWVSPFAARKLRTGHLWSSRFGWVTRGQLAHYERGEQSWKGQWLPAEQVAQFRKSWPNAWQVDTQHYMVRTNVSLERGVSFAEDLEKLHAIFFRLFAGFFTPREQAALLFEGNRRAGFSRQRESGPHRRFRVNFYRTAEEYMHATRPHVKFGLEATTGIYVPATRTAYFYVHEEMDQATVIHEATHQLFFESGQGRQTTGSPANYWVIEGIACYMESFEDCGDHVELGNWDTPRLKVGRQRIRRGQYVPIEKLVRLGLKDFEGPAVYTLYSQSACLCHFLMHHDNGRYREALVRYIEAVCLGQASGETLQDLVGVEYAELERQFREHVATASY